MSAATQSARWLGPLLVFVLFGAPLYLELGEVDVRSDEAIYSYAVDRILTRGNWMTPRSIPGDGPFFEKPPLKFWIVAAGIKWGGLPRSEFGLRFFDALFGLIAFGYVYAIGRQLGGAVAGVVAVFILFTTWALVFQHGLRENEMEAAVFLGYCGGMYHWFRWVEGAPRSRGHAVGVALYFLLAFLTKLVAAFFLPMSALAALAWKPGAWARVRRGWTDWLVPAALVVLLGSPWFVYHSLRTGREFWDILIGVHVYQRFTSSLDPTHLNPWHFYVTAMWGELYRAGSGPIVAAGLAGLTIAAVRGESWLSRLVLLWAVLPLAAMSLGTSKLLHYAYPFFPPLALAGGLAAATAVRLLWRLADAIGSRVTPAMPRAWQSWSDRATSVRGALVVVAAAFAGIATWTWLAGPIDLEVNGVRVLRNTSIWRPFLVAGGLLVALGRVEWLVRVAAAVLIAMLLPVHAYAQRIHEMRAVDHPLRAVADCLTVIRRERPPIGSGMYIASGDVVHHSYYYYFRRHGLWTIANGFSEQETLARLRTAGQQTPVIIVRDHYEEVYARQTRALLDPTRARGPSDPEPLSWSEHDGVVVEGHVAILLPGVFERCVQPALAAGARRLWRPRALDQ